MEHGNTDLLGFDMNRAFVMWPLQVELEPHRLDAVLFKFHVSVRTKNDRHLVSQPTHVGHLLKRGARIGKSGHAVSPNVHIGLRGDAVRVGHSILRPAL